AFVAVVAVLNLVILLAYLDYSVTILTATFSTTFLFHMLYFKLLATFCCENQWDTTTIQNFICIFNLFALWLPFATAWAISQLRHEIIQGHKTLAHKNSP